VTEERWEVVAYSQRIIYLLSGHYSNVQMNEFALLEEIASWAEPLLESVH
jgi:hypothetical protein